MNDQGRLIHTVEKAESSVFWIDTRYRYVAFSLTHCEMMRARFGAHIAIGGDILGYVQDPKQRATLQDLLDRALDGRTVVEVGASGDGTAGERHLEATYTPVPGPGGAIAGVLVVGRDVTAADRLESDLWRREQQLEQSQRLARMGHWYSPTDDGGVDLSGQALSMVGGLIGVDGLHTLDDVRALLRRIVHPEDKAKAEGLIEWSAHDGFRDFEFRVVDDLGHVSHLTGRVELVAESDGRRGILGVFQDDTEHWRTEQEFRFNEKRLRHAEELGGLGHWSVDPASGETRWSEGLYRIFGLDPDAVSPSPSGFFEMIHPDDQGAALEFAQQVGAAPGCGEITHRIVRPDGQVRLLRSRAETQTDETGEAVLLFGTGLDITELARTQGDLAESQERLRHLFTAMTEGFGYSRIVRDDQGRPVDWVTELANPALERLLGLGSVVGVPASSKLPGLAADHPELLERAGRVAAGGEPEEFDFQFADGEPWFHIWLRAGEPEHFTVLMTDVTERVLAEQEVDRLNRQLSGRVRELAAANEHLNELLYSLAHDLRSPLRAIDGFSLAFAEDHIDSTDERGAEQIGRVRAAAKRLGMLFDAALELADVRRGEVRPREVDLTTLAQSVADGFRARDPEREIVISVQGRMTDVADEGLARTVLEQLFANAWTATESRTPGRIEVGARVVRGERRYFVRDDGVGFDQSYAAKVFGSYQQLQPPHAGSGAGIGLTMVRHATGRLGGRCWAEARQDHGATFWFTLGPGPADAGANEAS